MDPSSSGQGPFPASSSAASSSPTTLNAIHINMNSGQVLRSMATQRATQSSSGSILPQMYEDEWLDRQINSNKSDSTHHMVRLWSEVEGGAGMNTAVHVRRLISVFLRSSALFFLDRTHFPVIQSLHEDLSNGPGCIWMPGRAW
jgi:hypothetical protein